MKLWVDDVRPAPEGYEWVKTVRGAKFKILHHESLYHYNPDYFDDDLIEVIDMDHDAGDFAQYGGDYIKLLDWLEETGRNYPIRIHSMNVVGAANMRAIIQKNGWEEVR